MTAALAGGAHARCCIAIAHRDLDPFGRKLVDRGGRVGHLLGGLGVGPLARRVCGVAWVDWLQGLNACSSAREASWLINCWANQPRTFI